MIKSCQFNFRFDVLFVCLNVTHLDFMIILLSVDYFEIIFQQSHKVTWCLSVLGKSFWSVLCCECFSLVTKIYFDRFYKFPNKSVPIVCNYEENLKLGQFKDSLHKCSHFQTISETIKRASVKRVTSRRQSQDGLKQVLYYLSSR